MANVSTTVLKWLIEYIQSNGLDVGDVLPSELELSNRLHVARSSVREAFAALKVFGVAQSKQRVGMILVSDPRRIRLMDLFAHDDFDLTDFMQMRELRSMIEVGAVGKLVANVRDEDIRGLQGLIDGVDGEGKATLSPVEFEILFHERIAEIIGNEIIQSLTLLYRPLFVYLAEHLLTASERRKMPAEVVMSHQKMVDALRERNSEKLFDHLRKILEEET